MFSHRFLRVQPLYGQLVKSYKTKLYILNQNVKLGHVFNKPNSNFASKASKTELMNSKANQEKDKLLFYYENRRFFIILNGFAFVQFFFWCQMAEFFNSKGDKIKMETNEHSPWWQKLDLQDKTTKRLVSAFCFLFGYAILAGSWIYTLRSVRMLVLRKDGKTVSIVTYGPIGPNKTIDVPLENMTTNVSRAAAKSQLPIKVKGKWFYYILDTKGGTFQNPELFDYTAGLKRTLK